MKRLLFVINNISGTQQLDYEAIIRDYFSKDLEFSLYFYYITWPKALDEIRSLIQHYNIEIAVAVGGDGTVNAVAQCVYGTNIRLGIIPAGSSNGLAKELQIPENIEDALDTIKLGYSRNISSLTINNQFSIHLSDIGFNAALIKQFKHNKIRGLKGYFQAGAKVLFKHKSNIVRVHTKDNIYMYDAIMVVIANASMYGTGLTINPICQYHDDAFEIIVIKKISIIEIIKMAFNNWIPNHQKTVIHQVKNVEIYTDEPAHFQIDGEYVGKTKLIQASINPAFIQVVTSP